MKIFISHSSRDDVFVNTLRSDLHRRGYITWVDHYDIPAGEVWDKIVEAQLRTCEMMILVVSSSAMQSNEVEIEWREFRSHEKAIIPIKIQECPVPLLIRHLQYIDFTREDVYDQQLRHLLNNLPPPPGNVTKDLVHDTKEFEVIKLKQELEQLKGKYSMMVGENQILFAFPQISRVQVFDIEREKTFIGWYDNQTGAKPDIDLTRYSAEENGVSRQHAMLTRTSNGLLLTDLDSHNGTFMNHRRLPSGRPIPLSNESVIYFGQLPVQVFYREDSFV